MANIQITKIEAARRQIGAAIRLLFVGGDPVAVHTLAAAASQIIRDICEKKGNVESYVRFKDWIVPEYEKEFWSHHNWSHHNKLANFLKHADRDPEETFDGADERVNDFIIMFASRWYRDLGYEATHEMRVFAGWFLACNPGNGGP